MSAQSETTKLEAMYYHMREAKHVAFLESHEDYAFFRNINTFKGGKEIVDGRTIVSDPESYC